MEKLKPKKMSLANLEGRLNKDEMEEVMAGSGISANCGMSLGGALILGTGGILFAATGGVGGIAFAMAANYYGWGMAAWSCS